MASDTQVYLASKSETSTKWPEGSSTEIAVGKVAQPNYTQCIV